MPVVARKTDRTSCPAHASGVIIEGVDEVLVCFKPVALKGDKILCKDGSIDEIIEGDPYVSIGGKPVARKGDATAHGGVISTGCPRVWIGQGIRSVCLVRAARQRAAFIRYSLKPKQPFIKPDRA